MKRIALPAVSAVLLACSCGSSGGPPASAEVLVVPARDSGGIEVHLVLRDAERGTTRADGAAIVEVIEKRSDPYAESGETEVPLYRGQLPVLRSHFRKITYRKTPLIAFPVGRIPYSDFFEAPTRKSGIVKIKFRARYSEDDIVGEAVFRF